MTSPRNAFNNMKRKEIKIPREKTLISGFNANAYLLKEGAPLRADRPWELLPGWHVEAYFESGSRDQVFVFYDTNPPSAEKENGMEIQLGNKPSARPPSEFKQGFDNLLADAEKRRDEAMKEILDKGGPDAFIKNAFGKIERRKKRVRNMASIIFLLIMALGTIELILLTADLILYLKEVIGVAMETFRAKGL